MKKVLALVMAMVLALAGVSALAEGSITVQGVGVVNVDADRAGISMGVRQVAADVMTAQASVNAKVEAVISALEALGIPRDAISTNGIGIYPMYDYSDYSDDERITGYNAYNDIYITVNDVNSVGAVIDAAFAAGANSLDYVQFSAADTAEAADKALALAVESARERAQVLAEAAGVPLGAILEIVEGDSYGADPTVSYARSEEADLGGGTQVLASKQQVSASVRVTFAIGE